MAEFINNSSVRLQKLLDFSRELLLTGTAKDSYTEHKSLIDTVDARETMQVIDSLLQEDISFEQVKTNIGKLLNLFYKSLKSNDWQKPSEGHFLYYLMQENREVEKILEKIKTVLKVHSSDVHHKSKTQELSPLIESLKAYELHYIKKENILFPYIENIFPQYRCLQLMWSFHDDFTRLLKTIKSLLKADFIEIQKLNKALGDLFFVVLPIIFREEQILYPVALQAIPEKAWCDMLLQSEEIGWCYIENQVSGIKYQVKNQNELGEWNTMGGLVDLGTGFLSPSQLILMLENLPVDITFVDENDEVRYFSGAKHRIFPRSKAIIGRKVQNCHPRESVHVVNEIVEAFKNGTRDHADFWIQMKGRFIHIRFFALRDQAGTYKGTIEVSQDCTEIRGLQGERRLLEWK
jgi:DUF438 domain-containing protein